LFFFDQKTAGATKRYYSFGTVKRGLLNAMASWNC
jgi:hypothetical protein